MVTKEIVLLIAFFLSLLALLAYIVNSVVKKRWSELLALLFLSLSTVFVIGYLFWRGLELQNFPLSNQYESLLVMLLGIDLIILLVYLRRRKIELLLPGVILSPLIFALLSLLDSSLRPLMPALRSNWLILHVFSSMFAYAAFAVAGVWALILLFQKRVAEDEKFLLRLARIGFILLTAGIISGSVWADRAWGRFWSWDPKETWSLITWLFYALTLHLYFRGWQREKFALMLLIGLLFVLFTYFGVNYILGGLHSYA